LIPIIGPQGKKAFTNSPNLKRQIKSPKTSDDGQYLVNFRHILVILLIENSDMYDKIDRKFTIFT